MDPTTSRMISAATESIPPVSITFNSNTIYPTYTQSIVLTWNVTNSLSQTINQGIGSVGASGSRTISSPTADGASAQRTYLITALGLNGLSYSSSVTISWAASTGLVYLNCPWPPQYAATFCTPTYI